MSITLKYRENELLKLLKISHEEYLKALEDFQRREKTYEQSISSYQRKLLSATSDNHKAIVEEMTEEILQKDNTIASLNRQINQMNASISNLEEQQTDGSSKNEDTPSFTSDLNSLKIVRLLEVKDSALKLKEFYINWLASRPGE